MGQRTANVGDGGVNMRDLTFRIKSKDLSEWLHFTIGEKLPNGDVFTLGQFTGCYDKKGVAIYEGDIIRKRVRTGRIENCAVSFEGGAFICTYVRGELSWQRDTYLLHDSQIEVVGNIYDNPELVAK